MSTKYIASNWRLPNQAGVDSYLNDNYGLTFDGSSEKINCGDSNVLSFGDGSNDLPFSISLWFNLSTLATPSCLLCKQTSSSNGEYKIYISTAGKIYIELANNGGEANGARGIISNSTISINQWYNIIFTYDGTGGSSAYDGMNLYINNSLDSSTDWSYLSYTAMNNTTADFIIGDLITGSSNTYDFTGKMSEVSVFDYALSEPQISTLYGSSSLGAGNPMALKPQPVAYYPLGDNSASNPLTQPNEAVEDASVFDFANSATDFISSDVNITGDWSVSMWINTDSTSYQTALQLSSSASTGTQDSIIFVRNTFESNKWGFYDGSTVLLGSVLDINKWHNLMLTKNGTTYTLFLNGTQESQSTKLNINITDLLIGKRSYSGFFFDGQISNVVLWNSDQSSEALNIYNSGVPATSYTNTPTAWYKLDQSANWEADSSGDWQIPDAVSAYPQSFDFSGGNYIDCGNGSSLSPSNFTLSVWAKSDLSNGSWISKYASENYGFGIYGGSIFLNIKTSAGWSGLSVTASSYLTADKWHHIVGTYDETDLKIYVDGNLAGTLPKAGPITYSSRNTRIGNLEGTSALDFNGQISNAQIFDTALLETGTDSVETLYNNGVPLTTAIASDNLKLWAKLDNSATFSTNWSVPDASGNGNTGTSSGMTEQNLVNNNVSALNGESSGMTSANLVLSDLTRNLPFDSYSFSFDYASLGHINVGNISSLNAVSNFSISVWVNPDNITSSNKEIFTIANSTSQAIVINHHVNQLVYGVGPTNQFNKFNSALTAGVWAHLCFVFDGSQSSAADKFKLYKNGVYITPTSATQSATVTPTFTGNAFIGAWALDQTNFTFDGRMSNFSIFNESLTSTEVMKLYSNGMPQDLSTFTPAPVAWWTLGSNSFFNGSNFICKDLSGNGNDGTSVNAGVDALVGDTPRSEANGVATNQSIPENLVGTTKYSSNNSWSINMSSTARVEDTP